MQVNFGDLGAVKRGHLEVGRLTVICGGNNSGKTFAAYAFYGALCMWREILAPAVPSGFVEGLMGDGAGRLELAPYVKDWSGILGRMCRDYSTRLGDVFVSSKRRFDSVNYGIEVESFDKTINLMNTIQQAVAFGDDE